MQEAYQEHAGDLPPLPQDMQAPQEAAGRASPLPPPQQSEGNVKANLTQAGSTEAIPAVPSGRQAGGQTNVQDALMCPRAKASACQRWRGNYEQAVLSASIATGKDGNKLARENAQSNGVLQAEPAATSTAPLAADLNSLKLSPSEKKQEE